MRRVKYTLLLVVASMLWSCSGSESGTIQPQPKQAAPGTRNHK